MKGGDALLLAHPGTPLCSLPRTLLKNCPPSLYERIQQITDSLEEMLQSNPGPCGKSCHDLPQAGPGGLEHPGDHSNPASINSTSADSPHLPAGHLSWLWSDGALLWGLLSISPPHPWGSSRFEGMYLPRKKQNCRQYCSESTCKDL